VLNALLAGSAPPLAALRPQPVPGCDFWAEGAGALMALGAFEEPFEQPW